MCRSQEQTPPARAGENLSCFLRGVGEGWRGNPEKSSPLEFCPPSLLLAVKWGREHGLEAFTGWCWRGMAPASAPLGCTQFMGSELELGFLGPQLYQECTPLVVQVSPRAVFWLWVLITLKIVYPGFKVGWASSG